MKKSESGQSTIEFLVSLTLIFGFVFSFFRIAITFTNGYLVHYAVFQASRAYLVFEGGSNEPSGSDAGAKTAAEKVFNSYLLPNIMPAFDSSLIVEDPDSHLGNETNLYVGARVEYEANLLIPGTGKKIGFPLVSESYLGREPTRAECFRRVCDAMAEVGAGSGCKPHSTVSDNGC